MARTAEFLIGSAACLRLMMKLERMLDDPANLTDAELARDRFRKKDAAIDAFAAAAGPMSQRAAGVLSTMVAVVADIIQGGGEFDTSLVGSDAVLTSGELDQWRADIIRRANADLARPRGNIVPLRRSP